MRGRPVWGSGPFALGVLSALFLLSPVGKALQVGFGPVKLEIPEGFAQAEGDALSPWEEVEVSRKRLKVFFDRARREKLKILLLSKGIDFPPGEGWKSRDFVLAFLRFMEAEAGEEGWVVSSREVFEKKIYGVKGLEFHLGLEKAGERKQFFCFLGRAGEEIFRLDGMGGEDFPGTWEKILEGISFEGVRIMSPFFWGLYGSLASFLVLAGFRYDLYRKKRKQFLKGEGGAPGMG